MRPPRALPSGDYLYRCAVLRCHVLCSGARTDDFFCVSNVEEGGLPSSRSPYGFQAEPSPFAVWVSDVSCGRLMHMVFCVFSQEDVVTLGTASLRSAKGYPHYSFFLFSRLCSLLSPVLPPRLGPGSLARRPGAPPGSSRRRPSFSFCASSGGFLFRSAEEVAPTRFCR